MLVPVCIVKCVNTFASQPARIPQEPRSSDNDFPASQSFGGPHGAYAISTAQIFDAYSIRCTAYSI